MRKQFTALILCLVVLHLQQLHSQSIAPFITNVAGGSYDNTTSYSRFEWNFGELTLTDTYTNAAANTILTQGLLQPCTDKIPGEYKVFYFTENEWKIFPNVTQGPFELDFFLSAPAVMQLQLTNALGQVINTRKFDYHCCSRIERYDISNLANGVYFINATYTLSGQDNLSEKDRVSRKGTFRVVKTGK